MTPVRFGILGTADIAARRFVPAAAATGATVTRVGSRDPGNAAGWAEANGVPEVGDYRSVLTAPDVDAVYIALPNALHPEWAERALDSGRHVLVEKPLAADADTARELFASARAAGLTLGESMTFGHHRQHRAASDAAGPATAAHHECTATFSIPSRPDDDIRYDASLGGGAIADLACYPVHVAMDHIGCDVEVTDVAIDVDPVRGIDVGGTATLRARSTGASAHIRFGFDLPYVCEYTLTGERGRVRVTRAFTAPPDHVPDVSVLDDHGEPERRIPLEPDDQFAHVVVEFTRAIGSGPVAQDRTIAVIGVCEQLRAHADRRFPAGVRR